MRSTATKTTTKSAKKTTLERIFSLVLVAGLAISPFVFNPSAVIPFEIPRVDFIKNWLVLLNLLLAAMFFRHSLSSQSSNARKKPGNWLALISIAGFFGIVLIGAYLGSDWGKSLVGNPYRGDSLVLLMLFASWVVLQSLVRPKLDLSLIIRSIALSSGLLSAWVVLDAIRWWVFGDPYVVQWQNAIGSFFGQPNFLAGYLGVTMPFALFQWARGKKRSWLGAIPVGLQIIATLATLAWGGLLAVFISLTGWLFLEFEHLRKIIILAGFAVIIVFGGVYWQKQWQTQQYRLDRLVAESRERIIIKGMLAFRQKPLLGWGWANFDHAFQAVNWPLAIERDVYVDKAHGLALELLVTTGILGLASFSLIVLFVFYQLSQGKTPVASYLMLVLIVYLLHAQTNVLSVAEEVMFWLVVAVTLSTPHGFRDTT